MGAQETIEKLIIDCFKKREVKAKLNSVLYLLTNYMESIERGEKCESLREDVHVLCMERIGLVRRISGSFLYEPTELARKLYLRLKEEKKGTGTKSIILAETY